MAASTSKGEYLTRVLSGREIEGAHGAGVRPPVTPQVERSVLLNAFRPAQEMSEPRLFAGRTQQVRDVADALQIVGSCPLIYGDRGLGKSSLAVQAQLIAMGDATLLEQLGATSYALPEDRTFLTIFVACSDDVQDTRSLLQLLINAASDVVASDLDSAVTHLVDRKTRRRVSFRVVEAETTKTFERAKSDLKYEELSLSERLQRLVRLLNKNYSSPVLFIVDELDRVRDKAGLASTIKALSSQDLKFMLVGIAQDWSDLLLDHVSLERQIAPVRVPRMQAAELAQIVDLAVDDLQSHGLDISFSSGARKRIVSIAAGFPWFVHVVGQAAVLSGAEDGVNEIDEDRVTRSIRELVRNRFAQHFADAYQRAVRDSVNRELTLRVFAGWRSTDIPTASVYPILRGLGVSNPAVYRGHLAREEYGSVIMTPGYQDRGLIRFRNEMFKQYIFMVPSLYGGVDDRVTRAMGDGAT